MAKVCFVREGQRPNLSDNSLKVMRIPLSVIVTAFPHQRVRWAKDLPVIGSNDNPYSDPRFVLLRVDEEAPLGRFTGPGYSFSSELTS